MNLSEHFTLEEMTRTSTDLTNNPGPDETAKLKNLCASLLEPIRSKWGPLKIDSGFRCPEVNKAVGGVPTSQHVFGEAADIVPMESSIDFVYDWIVRESGLAFGQCINERRGVSHWIHISLPRDNGKNQEALVFDGTGYKPYA